MLDRTGVDRQNSANGRCARLVSLMIPAGNAPDSLILAVINVYQYQDDVV